MRKSPFGLALVLAASLLTGCAAAPRPTAALQARAGAPDTRSQIVGSAMAMLGQPYRFGGAQPGGFDCSGLVAYAAGTAGIRLPRTAREQMRAGTAVGRRALRAGDLVFMHLARKELHVGIVIDGDRFVHAPSAGGTVRVDSLTAVPYARGFLRARRIVDDSVRPAAPDAPPSSGDSR